MGIIYDRQFELPLGETQTFDFSSLIGTFYILIYVEIDTRDLMNQTIDMKAIDSNINYPAVYSDDLIATEQGIARMPLYKILFTQTYADPIRAVYPQFYLFEADKVEIAKQALSLPGESKINGRIVNDIVNSNKNSVKKADNSDAIAGQTVTNSVFKGLRVNQKGYLVQRIEILKGSVSLPSKNNWVSVTSSVVGMRFLNFKVGIKPPGTASGGKSDVYGVIDYLKLNNGVYMVANGCHVIIEANETVSGGVYSTQITLKIRYGTYTLSAPGTAHYVVYGEMF
jgi:hypothetical protein